MVACLAPGAACTNACVPLTTQSVGPSTDSPIVLDAVIVTANASGLEVLGLSAAVGD